MMAKIWTKHSKPPLNIPKPGGETRQTCGKETRKLSAKLPCEQVQLLLAAKMHIFCRLPRAGYKTAVGGCKYPPHDSGNGEASPLIMRRAGAGARMPGLLFTLQTRPAMQLAGIFKPAQCVGFSFRCAGIENAGEVGMWAKKKTGVIPRSSVLHIHGSLRLL